MAELELEQELAVQTTSQVCGSKTKTAWSWRAMLTASHCMSDMMERADIVISEILDSALLGEGVLPSLRDAFTRLAKPGALAVPQSATVYGQVRRHCC